MTPPCWLRRAVRNRYCHAVEQASRRWRGGRCEDSARTRRKILISTQVVLEPWEWPPNALGAVARDLRATTGVVVDEGSFYRAVRWFCDRRAEGCRGARLQGDGSKTTYEAHSGKRSVEFSASPWDWPQTLGTDVAEELYRGETAQYRREGAEGIATKICKGNSSCAALPGASIILRLTEAAPYSGSLREEPAGCVERVRTRRPFGLRLVSGMKTASTPSTRL